MGEKPSTPKKLLQKVSQLIPVGASALYNILKVYQSWTPGKLFFSRWRPRWPPKPLNDHNYVTVNSNVMILMSMPRFWGARSTIKNKNGTSSNRSTGYFQFAFRLICGQHWKHCSLGKRQDTRLRQLVMPLFRQLAHELSLHHYK